MFKLLTFLDGNIFFSDKMKYLACKMGFIHISEET